MMKRKELCLSEQQFQKLQAESVQTGLSTSEIIRRAIDDFFSRKEKRNARNNKQERSN